VLSLSSAPEHVGHDVGYLFGGPVTGESVTHALPQRYEVSTLVKFECGHLLAPVDGPPYPVPASTAVVTDFLDVPEPDVVSEARAAPIPWRTPSCSAARATGARAPMTSRLASSLPATGGCLVSGREIRRMSTTLCGRPRDEQHARRRSRLRHRQVPRPDNRSDVVPLG